jgi:hypothetical protein
MQGIANFFSLAAIGLFKKKKKKKKLEQLIQKARV